jgi:hypothetical protein
MTASKFRKKPVVIEALQITDEATCEAAIRWVTSEGGDAAESRDQVSSVRNEWRTDGVFVYTLEGPMRASIGDWIIKGVKGEFYPCKPDIFEATYEVAE